MIARIGNVRAQFEFPAGGDHIAAQTQKRGWYERAMLEDIRGRVGRGLALDVGAYCGTHTVWFAKACPLRVVAFEPSPAAFVVLQRNLRRNRVAHRVRALNRAAGAAAGRGRLVEHDRHNTGTNTVEKDGAGGVQIVTIDGEHFRDVSLIKIDVEGAELDVLRGAIATIVRWSPLLYVEAPDTIADVTDMLEPLGYECFGQFNATPTFGFRKRG